MAALDSRSLNRWREWVKVGSGKWDRVVGQGMFRGFRPVIEVSRSRFLGQSHIEFVVHEHFPEDVLVTRRSEWYRRRSSCVMSYATPLDVFCCCM